MRHRPCRFLLPLVLFLSASLWGQAPGVGMKAPKFTAKSQTGQEVNFPPKGAWSILAFYPKASTPG